MSNIEPQIAAEYAALERLLRAVEEYREEVGELRKKRGLRAPGEIPRINIEVSSSLLTSLRSAASTQAPQQNGSVAPIAAQPTGATAPVAETPSITDTQPVETIPAHEEPAVPRPSVPFHIPAGTATTPLNMLIAAAQARAPSVSPSGRVLSEPFSAPPVAPAEAPAAPQTRPEMTPIPAMPRPASPEIFSKPASPEIPGAANTSTSGTSPGMPGPGLAFRSEPKPTLVAEPAKSVLPAPGTAPSGMPIRRPTISPSMQTETVGAFLRRFRLAAE